jgi:uncharacterized protein (DUF924 family)
MTKTDPAALLAFWKAAGPEKWFAKDDAFDAALRARFGAWLRDADDGALAAWEQTPDAALALVLLLDQVPRNIFRNDARAFERDAEALRVADAALMNGFDFKVDPDLRSFFYVPFMHAEYLAAQERCVALMAAWGGADNVKYAEIHRDIIARFGRFPHRNAVLARTTTAEEQAFLDEGGFAG